jgi:hypothetical protein
VITFIKEIKTTLITVHIDSIKEVLIWTDTLTSDLHSHLPLPPQKKVQTKKEYETEKNGNISDKKLFH